MFKFNLWPSEPEVDALHKKRKWKPTWVRQDGVCLRQKLVTPDALVSFFAPDGGKTRNHQSMSQVCLGAIATRIDGNAGLAHKKPHQIRQGRQNRQNSVAICIDLNLQKGRIFLQRVFVFFVKIAAAAEREHPIPTECNL